MLPRAAPRPPRATPVATVAHHASYSSFSPLFEPLHVNAVSITLDTLETPVPIVDLDRLARNLDRVARYAKEHSLALRPHIKTHKSHRIATEQIRLGAVGLTCSRSPHGAKT